MKRLITVILTVLLILLLTACHGEEMERFFIVTAMAVDWEEERYVLRLEGSADEMDENKNPKAILHTGRGDNLTQCFLDIQKQTGVYPYTRQTQLILLSGQIPPDALDHLMDDLLNENGVRLNARMAITGGKAADLLQEGDFASQRILKAVTKGGGTLTSSDIMLRDLAYTREAEGLSPVLPMTDSERTEGLCLLRDGVVAGNIEPALVPVFMMAGGTERGGAITVEVNGEACAFRLLKNRAKIRTVYQDGRVIVTVSIDGQYRAADRLEGDVKVYEDAIRSRLERDLLELVDIFGKTGCDALGFGQALSRWHPRDWDRLESHWEAHLAACEVIPEISVTITSTGKMRAGE